MTSDHLPRQMLPPQLEIEYADIIKPAAATSPLEFEAELERSGVIAPAFFRMTYTMEFANSDQVR